MPLQMTSRARGRLMALRQGVGWDDLLDLCEKLCEVTETEFLKTDRWRAAATDAQVLSAHDQCRAQRAFFERMQVEVNSQVALLMEEQKRQVEVQRGVNLEQGIGQAGQEVGTALTDDELLGLSGGGNVA